MEIDFLGGKLAVWFACKSGKTNAVQLLLRSWGTDTTTLQVASESS
jgi:hypothetical protein